MSLNDFPVKPEIVARVHSELRNRLNADKSLVRVSDDRFSENSKQQFHSEYWKFSDWVFIMIGNLYYPQLNGNFNIQVMIGIPNEVWKPEYEDLRQILTQATLDSMDRNPILEQMVSRKASEYSFSKGIFHRDSDSMSIKKEALKIKMKIMSHVNKLNRQKPEIIKGFCDVLDKGLKL